MHFCADPVNKHEKTKKHFIISSEAADAKQELLSFTGLWNVEAVVHAGLPWYLKPQFSLWIKWK